MNKINGKNSEQPTCCQWNITKPQQHQGTITMNSQQQATKYEYNINDTLTRNQQKPDGEPMKHQR